MENVTRALAALPRAVLILCGALGVVAGVLAVMAVVEPEWIESVAGLYPDGGSGETEASLAVVFAVAAVLLLTVAVAGAVASRVVARTGDAGATS